MDNNSNAFDFIVNEEDEVMLLLYARDSEPKNASFEVNTDDLSAVLHRNDQDSIIIDRIPDEVFDSLQDADILMVCELNQAEKEEDTEIVYVYEADITF